MGEKRGKRILIFSAILFFIAVVLFIRAENPVTAVWSVNFDGPLSQYEEPYGVALDSNSNVYVVGYSPWNSIFHVDLYLGKWNSSGTNLYNATMGYPLADHVLGKGIAIDNRTSDIYIVGYTQMNAPSTARDIYLGKFNSTNGNNIWNRTLNGLKDKEDYGYGVAVDNNSNIYVTGWIHWNNETTYDIYLGKWNSSGTNLWNTTVDMLPNGSSTKHELGYGVAADSLGYVYVTGGSWTNNTTTALYLGKFNSSGNNLWNLTVNNPRGSGSFFGGKSIVIYNNTNIYVVGDGPWSSGTSSDIYLGKFNSSGSNLFNFTLNGPQNSNDYGGGVTLDNNSNIYISGFSLWNYPTHFDVYIGKFNSSGNNLWNTTIGAGIADYDFYNSNVGGNVVVQPYTGDLYITATSNYSGGGNANIYLGKFAVDTIDPTADFSCSPSTITVGSTITCTCSPSDVFSGINSSLTSYVAHPDTSQSGSFTTSCSFADVVGNTGSSSFSYTVTTSGVVSPTTGTTSIPSAPAGEPTSATISNPNIEVRQITVTTTENVSGVSVIVTELSKSKTADFRVGVNTGGLVYQALNITVIGLNNSQIVNATVNFRVNKTWIETKNVSFANVSLFRRNDVTGAWGALNTNYLSEDSNFYYYIAVTPGFSTFLIFYGRYDCEPGINRCFENQIQLCLGNATWLTTEKCSYGCDEQGECIEAPPVSKIIYPLIVAVVSMGIVVGIYFVARKFRKKKRK